MSEPYIVETVSGYCAGCLERIRFGRRWAHRRCAQTLMTHRQPYVTKPRRSLIALMIDNWPGTGQHVVSTSPIEVDDEPPPPPPPPPTCRRWP